MGGGAGGPVIEIVRSCTFNGRMHAIVSGHAQNATAPPVPERVGSAFTVGFHPDCKGMQHVRTDSRVGQLLHATSRQTMMECRYLSMS